MSKAVKSSIIILILLLAVTVISFFMVFMQKQTMEQQNQALMTQLSETESHEIKLQRQIQDLDAKVKDFDAKIVAKEGELQQATAKLKSVEGNLEQINSQITKLREERDDWKGRVKTVSDERDKLMKELQERPEKVVYKEKIVERPVEVVSSSQPVSAAQPMAALPVMQSDKSVEAQQEEYWAQVLKQKADLELKLEALRKEVDSRDLEIVELKKYNSDFKLEISRIANEKAEIVRNIKHGEDLANNLSIELARAKNESKFVQQQADRIKNENQSLRGDVKSLTNQKLSLEKSVSRLTEEKAAIEKKLIETENVIQGRIEEIWKIKDELDKRFEGLPVGQSSNQVELPPIIVSAGNNGEARMREQSNPAKAAMTQSVSSNGQGSVVSVNEANNFVIIDVGEADGARLGDVFQVFRGDHQVATVEIIQIRKDISAADIKQKATKPKVGDVVRR